jgi:hypothetical protein
MFELDEDIDFNIEVIELSRLPLKEGFSDVVCKVKLEYTATYNGVTETHEKEFALDSPDSDSFIAYADLALGDIKRILATESIILENMEILYNLQTELKYLKGTPWE